MSFARSGSIQLGLSALTLLSATTSSSWAQTQPPAAKAVSAASASKAKAPKTSNTAPAAQASEGFSIAPAPAWVLPLQPEASTGLPSAPLQLLLIDKQTRIEPTGTVRYQHVLRQINEASGLQKGAQIELDFDPSFQKLQFHRLEVWRDGKRLDRLDRKRIKLLHREPQLERQIIDGRMTASIVLEDLRVGDRVEWAVSLVGDNPVFGGKFVDQEWTSSSGGPVGLVQLRLLSPAERNIQHRVAEPSVEVSSRVDGAWRETLFKRRLVPQFHYEETLPIGVMVKDQVQLSEFANWAEVAGWAEQLFAKAMLPAEALDAQAREIEARAQTPEERLRLALDFVQKEIRYFGTEIGANSHQPAPTEQVLRQRFGDCKDKAALLVTLLKKLGIEATPALVAASLRSDAAQRLPSPLAFDHAIAAVQLGEQTLWLDATRGQQRGAPTERQSVGLGVGLLAKAGSSELSRLPAAREALRLETVDTFSFPRLDQPGTLRSVSTYHGDMAEWMREARAALPAADFRNLLAAETLRFYPGLTVDGEPELSELDGRNALRVELKYRSGEFWTFPEKRWLAGPIALPSLVAQLRLPDQTPRTQPMRLAMNGRYLHTVRYEFSEPLYSQPSDSRFEERNEHFELRLRYRGEPKMQQIEGELRLQAEQVAAGKWSAYRDQLNKVAPRLANTITVPVLGADDLAGLRRDMTALTDRMRKGSLKVLTEAQGSAHARLLMMDRVLAADRLPPKLRAAALVERAVQLDHLGQSDRAQTSLYDAAQLHDESPEVHAALAVNALMQRKDEQAVSHAERALALAPNDTGVRYTRVYARYFGGQVQEAQKELQEILQSGSEVERGYGSIWLYLSSRKLGQDGLAAIRELRPSGDKPAWPYPVLQMLQGSLDLDGALAMAREGKPEAQADRGRDCELYFYAAQKALLDQDLPKARNYLKKSLATGVVEFNEYSMAQRELDRIGAR